MTLDQPSDEALMERIKCGDDAAFAMLFDRHYRRVLNTVYRFLGNESEAEDLAQEAFLRVYRAAARYEPRAKVTTWLYQIVGNLCLNFRRDKGRRHERPVQNAAGATSQIHPISDKADSSAGDIAAGLEVAERSRVVRECLDQLPSNQRMALILMHYEGLGYADIAQALEVTPGAAKALCHRARETLRDKLQVRIRE